jgi:dienelactone hydrolase
MAIVMAVAPTQQLNSSTVTVSGISAGGAMAVQVATAFSATVQAAGVIAGLPYMCALQRLPTLTTAEECMNVPSSIDVAQLQSGAVAAADLGEIDNLSNLRSRVFLLFSGLNDTVVQQGSMAVLASMLRAAGSNVTTVFDYHAEHAWVTDQWGDRCIHLGAPYVNDCHFDFAGNFLRLAFTEQFAHALLPRTRIVPGNMYTFDQRHFGASPLVNGLDSEGYIYVPTNCSVVIAGKRIHGAGGGARRCHLHINFHGCEQGRGVQGDSYVTHTGLNEWAEDNGIVVVYPQVVKSDDPLMYNPKGCFDWWGYSTGVALDFAVKEGPQMAFVWRIVEALTSL